ncbi:MAG: hypothetical protein GYA60_04535, partial [Candidatus Methanofastidiosa archaeon]|nr:hypothetical protein [Candidatus Methanofastidiosa archaeon]
MKESYIVEEIKDLKLNNPMRKFYIGVDLLDTWERLIFAFHSKEAGLIIEQELSNE